MSIFNHPHATAASKCANCRHLEVIIADLQAWVDDRASLATGGAR